MATKDRRVDAYIARSAAFARPILKRLRSLVHSGCPGVVETIKWGVPFFDFEGTLCNMAAFKGHCAFGFWNRSFLPANPEAMGQFGRLTALSDLPMDEVVIGYVEQAARFNASGQRAPAPRRPKKDLPVPTELAAALDKNARARASFEGFTPAKQREYVEWITEAKTAQTREKRLETALGWIAEGKPRNWKYMTSKPRSGSRARAGSGRGVSRAPKRSIS